MSVEKDKEMMDMVLEHLRSIIALEPLRNEAIDILAHSDPVAMLNRLREIDSCQFFHWMLEGEGFRYMMGYIECSSHHRDIIHDAIKKSIAEQGE